MDATALEVEWHRPPDPVPHARLQPGTWYHIVIDDCCAEGEFTARFEGWEFADPAVGPQSGMLPVARFAEAIRLWGFVWLAYPAA